MSNDMQWDPAAWKAIQDAVMGEDEQINIGKLILPHIQVTSETLTIPAERIVRGEMLTVDESGIVAIIDIAVDFALSTALVDRDKAKESSITGTVAMYGQKDLSAGRDVLIFQGYNGFAGNDFFKHKQVRVTNLPHRNHYQTEDSYIEALKRFFGPGLLGAAEEIKQIVPVEPIEVDPHDPSGNKYGENTYTAVVKAIALAIGKQHRGPWSLALPFDKFSDANSAIPATLNTPGDRIYKLIADNTKLPDSTGLDSGTVRFYGTSTLPPSKGVLVSFGGKSVELVLGMDLPEVRAQSETLDNQMIHSVRDRFGVLIRDATAIVELHFLEKKSK